MHPKLRDIFKRPAPGEGDATLVSFGTGLVVALIIILAACLFLAATASANP